ncbi:hypothetical protein BaRGS_00000614, partial [Batillaria attramentaria]
LDPKPWSKHDEYFIWRQFSRQKPESEGKSSLLAAPLLDGNTTVTRRTGGNLNRGTQSLFGLQSG